MTGLKIRQDDTTLATRLNNFVPTNDADRKYVSATNFEGTNFFLQAKARPNITDKGLAFRSLTGINEYLTNKFPVVFGDVQEVDVPPAKEGDPATKVTKLVAKDLQLVGDDVEKGRFILIAATAKKVHDAVTAKVGFFASILDWVKSKLFCTETELQKNNKLYAEIIKKCQEGYDATAPKKAETPKKPAAA